MKMNKKVLSAITLVFIALFLVSAKYDAMTDAQLSIDYYHHEIHGGSAYYVQYSVASLGAATTPTDMATLTFKTANTKKWPHYQFSVEGTAGWRVRLIEAPTGGFTGPTGQLVPVNHNRNSPNTSGVYESTGTTVNEVDYDAVLATGGTTLWDEYLGGVGGPFGGGSGTGTRNELILKQNTVYQLSVLGTDADPVTLLMDWYEHTSVR